ncbi:3-phosphoshikimate 1-carboxyvinyltransferase [Parasediminibacterium sp. JCM 36343]|uniref:3-phosphoshikimate 1-carboxyvinyltransferase n=1 Tax=Parasediminibacterium sp. JCM 36343 TaxID=3374279 RepID=UPI003977F812
MIVTIQPSQLKGTITAAASKSSMQRACAAALLHIGQTVIQNPGISNDDLAAIKMIQDLGATIQEEADKLIVNSEGMLGTSNEALTVNCGESGLGIRMFTPIAALSSKPITITGKGSLLTRPMDFFDTVLPQLGVHITSNSGKLPLHIQGPLAPAAITVDGSLSSQFLTGLLFAFAASAKEEVTITVTDLKSKPYIDLSLKVLTEFGYAIVNNHYESFTIKPLDTAKQKATIDYTVEGDWSGAAFLLVAGAIAGDITVKGLDVFSTQADKKILEALQDCGCTLSVQEKQIEVACPPLGIGGDGLKAFHFDATDCPDLFPPLVALAAYCHGKTVIEGVSRLAHKESDRGITLQQEFAKLGVEIILQGDLMIIDGGNGLKGATVHSRHDHRIAMACAVAALPASGEVTIEEADAVNKSYPNFYKHIEQIGALVSIFL